MSVEFGKKLKYLREKAGLYQSDLAEELNVSSVTILHWEKGKTEPNINQIKFIANYFKVSTDYLLGEEIVEESDLNKKLAEARQLAKDLQQYLPEAERLTEERLKDKSKKNG